MASLVALHRRGMKALTGKTAAQPQIYPRKRKAPFSEAFTLLTLDRTDQLIATSDGWKLSSADSSTNDQFNALPSSVVLPTTMEMQLEAAMLRTGCPRT